MLRTKTMVLRVQSPEGTKRIEISPSSSTSQLFEQVFSSFGLNSYNFSLYKQKNKKDEIASSKSRTISGVGLKHGDMLYLTGVNGAIIFQEKDTTNKSLSVEPIMQDNGPSTSTSSFGNVLVQSRPTSTNLIARPNSSIEENDVDVQLSKLDGKIERNKDPKLCRHNSNSRCFHCSPLEPYDDAYLREQNIKHLSFHSFLRKMTSGVDRGKFLALEDVSCRIKSGCKDHPPWPKGICSKCQPNAVTLNRQVYRHVDNVAFENTNLVETFLNYWRTTGHQRIGFLYGTYEIYTDVPLGIRANVAAIYEPPQESTRDSVCLLPNDQDDIVNQLAAALGLRCVGWIFTDLIPDDVKKGTVKHIRNINTHFLSAQECITAGYFQSQHPNPCKYSSNGYFGSKFVTVCVTGDKSNQVHMEGYQVSNQCMALVRDNCLLPTKDAPELGYVRESSDRQYVPDVYYKEKDSYGNEVSRMARPLPVEYLLVDVPASTPLIPTYTFNPDTTKKTFPIENRMVDGHIQDFTALSTYLSQFETGEFLNAISDFHLLLYIATMDMLPMRDYMGPLLEAIKNRCAETAEEWSRSEHWATVEQLIAVSSPPPSRPNSVTSGNISVGTSAATIGGGVSGSQWTCPICTFLNPGNLTKCEMCNSYNPALH